jgi:hypothetical protein
MYMKIIILGFGGFTARLKAQFGNYFRRYVGGSLEGSGLELGVSLAFVTAVG